MNETFVRATIVETDYERGCAAGIARGRVLREYAIEHITRLENEVERLQAALIPFAVAARCAEKDEGDDYSIAGSSARHEMTLGDLRRARAVFEPEALPTTRGEP